MVERAAEAVPLLEDAHRCALELRLSPLLAVQPACNLALALLLTGRLEDARRLCGDIAPAVLAIERDRGEAAAPGAARLHLVEGRLALRGGDVQAARRLLHRAVAVSRTWGWPSLHVLALTGLAEAGLAARDRPAARDAVARATEVARTDPVWPFVLRDLAAVAARTAAGRDRVVRRSGALLEELTDRELSLLRMLAGTANQREIGAALFLSINTVKGYAKSLYRKLDVPTRQDAVDRGRELGLI
jgi:LuxR family maltose regulon positive regulatory protein